MLLDGEAQKDNNNNNNNKKNETKEKYRSSCQ